MARSRATCHDLGLPLVRPDPFPQNSLLAAQSLWRVLAGLGSLIFARRCSRRNSARAGEIAGAAVIQSILDALGVEADPLLGSSQIVEIKARLRSETGGSAAPRCFRVADVHHPRR